MKHYESPAWLPGGNLQTIWAATRARRHLGAPPRFTRERWATPDGDFIDVDHLCGSDEPSATPPPRRLVLFHGLEGSSRSAYAQAFASVARLRGWAYSVPHFRGCSGELNLAPRAYHSGDFEEIAWILQRLRAASPAPLLVVGISLGGNALLRWAQEAGDSAAATAAAVAAVCSPIDLAAAGHAIDRGFNRLVYSRMFLRTMKPRALAKWQQHPGLFDRGKLAAARTLYEFDNVFTAPLHGFRDTPDYWQRASAKPQLARIRIPALVLNARNDPFVPAASLPAASHVGRHVTLWQPAHGGHVGFPHGRPPGHVVGMPQAVAGWLAAQP
ncbi:MAG: alpha/beta hydrolase [Leptothrix sp. (in: Bacteria)]|nr:alpha/beta hydrolase [Leptothrix sp. (in: b-proteobacteria)]